MLNDNIFLILFDYWTKLKEKMYVCFFKHTYVSTSPLCLLVFLCQGCLPNITHCPVLMYPDSSHFIFWNQLCLEECEIILLGRVNSKSEKILKDTIFYHLLLQAVIQHTFGSFNFKHHNRCPLASSQLKSFYGDTTIEAEKWLCSSEYPVHM